MKVRALALFLKMTKKTKKKNPLDEFLEELENYDDGCEPKDLMSSGE